EEFTVTLLLFTPVVVPVTFNGNVHDDDGAKLPPVKLTTDELATAVITAPPQEPINPFGVAMTNPAGSVSVNATPVRVVKIFGLEIVKFRPILLFRGIVAAPNEIVIDGGLMTSRLAEGTLPVPASLELTEAVASVCKPSLTAFTLTEKEQFELPFSVRPERLIVFDPAVAVMNPPQEPLIPLGVATTSPAGRKSANPTSCMATVLGLLIVKIYGVVPFVRMVAAPKLLVIKGGETTTTLAFTATPSTTASAEEVPGE